MTFRLHPAALPMCANQGLSYRLVISQVHTPFSLQPDFVSAFERSVTRMGNAVRSALRSAKMMNLIHREIELIFRKYNAAGLDLL